MSGAGPPCHPRFESLPWRVEKTPRQQEKGGEEEAKKEETAAGARVEAESRHGQISPEDLKRLEMLDAITVTQAINSNTAATSSDIGDGRSP